MRAATNRERERGGGKKRERDKMGGKRIKQFTLIT